MEVHVHKGVGAQLTSPAQLDRQCEQDLPSRPIAVAKTIAGTVAGEIAEGTWSSGTLLSVGRLR